MKKLREHEILDLLKKRGSIKIKDIVDLCGVSENTARRDLQSMEKQVLLVRTHGGAIQLNQNSVLPDFETRLQNLSGEKERIAKRAASFINDNDVIYIDCGTTLFFIHKFLKDKENLIVITHSLPLIYQLSNQPRIKLVIIGGEVDKERKAVYGSIAEKNINEYHTNKAFIGSDGISLANGLSTYEMKEGLITKRAAENSKEVFLVCTSDKIEKDAFVNFASFDLIDHIITDNKIANNVSSKYKERVDLIICGGDLKGEKEV
jgi:DeoR family fructose operon transcriptional repressor